MSVRVAAVYLFFACLALQTPFNSSGWMPLPLVSAGWLGLVLCARSATSRVYVPRPTAIDGVVLAFLFCSTLSVIVNAAAPNTLNLNHLLAQYVVITLYYFVVKVALYDFVDDRQVLRGISVAFLVLVVTGIGDYLLLLRGIDLRNLIPMPLSSPVAGFGVFVRARGFMVEPTDLGMALNAVGPPVFTYLFRRRRTSELLVALSAFVAVHAFSRSAAAVASLALGLTYATATYGFSFRLSFPRYGYQVVAAVGLIVATFVYAFHGYVADLQAGVVQKILFGDNVSSQGRLASWLNAYDVWLSGNLFFGRGTGYMSASQSGTLNWYASILVENGLLGVSCIASIYGASLYRLAKMRSGMRYGLVVAFVATAVHLFTQTGFYLPFLWLLLVLIQKNWRAEQHTVGGAFATAR